MIFQKILEMGPGFGGGMVLIFKWGAYKIPDSGLLKWVGYLSGKNLSFQNHQNRWKIIEKHCDFAKISRLRRFYDPPGLLNRVGYLSGKKLSFKIAYWAT